MPQAEKTPVQMIPGWSKPGCLWDHQEARVGRAEVEREEQKLRSERPVGSRFYEVPHVMHDLTLSEVKNLWKEVSRGVTYEFHFNRIPLADLLRKA